MDKKDIVEYDGFYGLDGKNRTLLEKAWEKTIKALEKKCRAYIIQWQDSPWLRGKLVLFLDENMGAELLGYRLKYSYEKGLACKKECDENE